MWNIASETKLTVWGSLLMISLLVHGTLSLIISSSALLQKHSQQIPYLEKQEKNRIKQVYNIQPLWTWPALNLVHFKSSCHVPYPTTKLFSISSDTPPYSLCVPLFYCRESFIAPNFYCVFSFLNSVYLSLVRVQNKIYSYELCQLSKNTSVLCLQAEPAL